MTGTNGPRQRRGLARLLEGAPLAAASAAALALAAPSTAMALQASGAEVLVSTSISEDDLLGIKSVVLDADGKATVVWSGRGTAPPPGNIDRVLFRQFPRTGSPGSVQFADPLSFDPGAPTPTDRRFPSVANNADGEFAIAWTENLLVLSSTFQQIYARWFDADGAPATPAAAVALNPPVRTYQADISIADNGSTVVGWTGYRFSNQLLRQFRVYPVPGGLPPDGEQTVLQDTMPSDNPAQAFRLNTWSLADGAFRYGYRTRNASNTVRIRPFTASGAVAGDDIVGANLAGDGMVPLRVTPEGYYLGYRFSTSTPAIWSKIYDPDLNLVFESSLIPNSQQPLAFAMDRVSTGESVMAFMDQQGGLFRVFARAYDRNGNPTTGILAVSPAFIPVAPVNIDVAMGEGGDAVITWSIPEFPDNPTAGVYMRRYTFNRTPFAIPAQDLVFEASPTCSTAIAAIELDGGSFDPDGPASSLTYTISPSGPFGIGQHTVTFTVTDPQGASDSAQTTFTVVDITPPTTPPAPSAGNGFVATTTPTLTWPASVDCQAVVYRLQVGTTEGASDLLDQDGLAATSRQLSLPGDGVYFARVMARDASGNESPFGPSAEFTVDTVPPTVPGTPTAGADFIPSRTLNLSWTASTDANFATHEVQIGTAPGASNIFNGTADGNTLARTVGADGTYYIRVRGRDLAGNTSAWSPNGQVVVDTIPPTRPGEPLAPQTPIATLEVPLAWTPSTDANLSGYDLRIGTNPGGTNIFSGIVPADPSFTVTVPADGTYYTRVRGVDAAGNLSTFSPVGSFTSDTTGPTTPGTPTVGTALTNDPEPTFTWTASTDPSGVAGYTLQVGTEPGVWDVFDASVGATTSQAVALPADGAYSARVRAVDTLGNPSEWSPLGAVELDTTPPTLMPGQDLVLDEEESDLGRPDLRIVVIAGFSEPVRTTVGSITYTGLRREAVTLAGSDFDASGFSKTVTNLGANGAGPFAIEITGTAPEEAGEIVVRLDGAPIRDFAGNDFDASAIEVRIPIDPAAPAAFILF